MDLGSKPDYPRPTPRTPLQPFFGVFPGVGVGVGGGGWLFPRVYTHSVQNGRLAYNDDSPVYNYTGAGLGATSPQIKPHPAVCSDDDQTVVGYQKKKPAGARDHQWPRFLSAETGGRHRDQSPQRRGRKSRWIDVSAPGFVCLSILARHRRPYPFNSTLRGGGGGGASLRRYYFGYWIRVDLIARSGRRWWPGSGKSPA